MNDLKFAFRQLLKNPGFTAVAVLTLALGIGANTAIFTVINTVLLRSLPVRNPNELIQVVMTGESGRPNFAFSYPFYEQLRDGRRSLSGLFAAGGVGLKDRLLVPNGGNAETEFVRAQPVSGNFFSVLGVPALIGRTLTAADDQAGSPQAVAVISHSFWQRRFGGDASVVGRAVTFDDVPFTIVGVTPPDFFGFQPGENPELWWPLQIAPRIDGDPSGARLKEGSSWLRLMGRLSPGIERAQAEAELGVIFQRYQGEFAASRAAKWSDDLRRRYFAQRFELWTARAGWTGMREQFRQPLLILMAASAVVLLIACANVASLLLARAAARRREFSVRSALGGGRLRLIRQLLTESLLLAALGGLSGLLFAQGGTRLLQIVMRLPNDSIQMDLLGRLEVLPGVRTASMFNFGLLSGNYWTDRLLAEAYQAEPGEDLECSGTFVVPRFFETFGMPLLSGRDFGLQDAPVGATNAFPKTAVVNQALARRYFGDVNPLGRQVYFAESPERKFEIVGIVPDAKYRTLRAATPPTIYLPFFRADSGATFAVRTSADPAATMASLRSVVQDVDRTVRVRDIRTMEGVVNGTVHQERLIAQLGGFFSVFALGLACLGLYGVLSFAVVQRTREIGVRVALGAQRSDVLSLVVGTGLKLALIGSGLGLAGALAATRLVSNLLYGVTPTDPMTFAGVALLLIGVAVFASWLPARRAAKVDPMEALRCE